MIRWIVTIFVIYILLWARTKDRGYFWKAKDGRELGLRQFFSQWRKGVEGITPLQQVKVSLWSFIPLFGGLLWGIVITFLAKSYWLTAILGGSLPITSIQFVSTLQKYLSIKKVEEVMKDLNKKTKKNGKNK